MILVFGSDRLRCSSQAHLHQNHGCKTAVLNSQKQLCDEGKERQGIATNLKEEDGLKESASSEIMDE